MSTTEDFVDVEVQFAGAWYSVNDGYRYKVTAGSLGDSAVSLNRIEASSPFYDGSYQIHTTKGNITELIEVTVYGVDNVEVKDNIARLIKWFSQPTYKVRRTLGEDVTTWQCYTAEYSIERSHILIHNRMARVKFNVPRLPWEVSSVL